MRTTKRHTRFVIFARPLNADEPTRYVEPHGATTGFASLAVRFPTVDEARTYALQHGIELNQRRYIGPEGFTELELHRH